MLLKGVGLSQVSDMMEWASSHSWNLYLQERDGSHDPYGAKGPAEHLGRGHDLIVLPGGIALLTPIDLSRPQVATIKALCSAASVC